MLKSNPDHNPPRKPRTGKASTGQPMAAPTDDAVPGIYAGPFATVPAGDEVDQRESLLRSAHRMRMKEFFARANSAI
jgi:hypothetical protein